MTVVINKIRPPQNGRYIFSFVGGRGWEWGGDDGHSHTRTRAPEATVVAFLLLSRVDQYQKLWKSIKMQLSFKVY